MIQNSNLQVKMSLTEFLQETFGMKSAFTVLSKGEQEYKNEERNIWTTNINGSFLKENKQLSNSTSSKHVNSEGETWQPEEIGRLFSLYDFYGPMWKVMSEKMPNRELMFQFRTANNLKNRFYTVLRNLIKLLFRLKSDICPKLPGEIPSKDLSRLYDGKEGTFPFNLDYQPFSGFISNLLKEIDFDLESPKMGSVVEQYCSEILGVYHVIYGERARTSTQNLKMSQNQVDCFNGMLFPTSCEIQRADEIEKVENSCGSETSIRSPFGLDNEPKQDFFYFYYFHPSNFYLQGV